MLSIAQLKNVATALDNASQVVAPVLQHELTLSEAQAARILGVKPITLRAWRNRDKDRPPGSVAKAVPHVTPHHPGEPYRYRASELLRWLEQLPTHNGVPQLPDNRRQDHRDHFGVNAG